MGPFPTSKSDNRYILVLREYLMRWCEAAALLDATTSTVAKAHLDNLDNTFWRHRYRAKIVPQVGIVEPSLVRNLCHLKEGSLL